MREVFVFGVGRLYLCMGSMEKCGLTIAVDVETARQLARLKWSDLKSADVDSGEFRRVCSAVKRDGAKGVWLHFVHAGQVWPAFYTWQELEGLAGEHSLPSQNESHGAALHQLAELLAAPTAAAV